MTGSDLAAAFSHEMSCVCCLARTSLIARLRVNELLRGRDGSVSGESACVSQQDSRALEVTPGRPILGQVENSYQSPTHS